MKIKPTDCSKSECSFCSLHRDDSDEILFELKGSGHPTLVVGICNHCLEELLTVHKVVNHFTGLPKLSAYQSCPNCGSMISDKTLISRSDIGFEDEDQGTYSWTETHRCTKCYSFYLINNGT